MCSQCGLSNEAIETATDAVNVWPNNAKALAILGSAFGRSGRAEDITQGIIFLCLYPIV